MSQKSEILSALCFNTLLLAWYLSAPRYKVQTFDVSAEEIVFTDIIEEDEKAVLGNVAAIRDDLLFVNYSRDV